MEVIFYNLLKVNNDENTISVESFANKQNIQGYIWDLITNCVDTTGDREYIFDPNLQTTKTHIDNIIQNNNSRDDVCKLLAEKLLSVENDTKEKIAHLDKEIPKGILMISFTKMTETEYKLIITKADYTEFLEELHQFIKDQNFQFKYTKILTYDASSKKAAYWWKNFLELSEVRDDIKNTKTAYDAIKKDIIEPLRRKHKQDYLCLRNATIAYFRAESDFDINHYKDVIVGNYKPFDNFLNIEDIKTKIEKLPQKYGFDNSFQKIPTVIKDKFKDVIQLTDEIELKLKQDIINIERFIQPYKDEKGDEYIMILSADGYQYATGLRRNQNE